MERGGATVRSYDKFQYIRDYYGVPAYKGVRVNAYGKEGVITGADNAYILIRLDGAKQSCLGVYARRLRR